nr:phosphodiester glycosidase family protein [uncultured Marinifilum sp.]
MIKNRVIALVTYKKLIFHRLLFLILTTFCVANTYAFVPNKTKEQKGADSVEYNKITFKNGPVVIHQLRIDLAGNNYEFSGGVANKYLGFGLAKTSQIVEDEKLKGNKIIAAVNADFFGGIQPVFQNCMIVNGKFVKGVKMSRTLFAVSKKGDVFFNKYQFNGIVIINKDTLIMNGLNVPVENDKCCFYNEYYRKMPVQKDSVIYWRIKPLGKSVIDSICEYRVEERLVNPDSLNFVTGCKYLGAYHSLNNNFKINDSIGIQLGISPNKINPDFMIGGLPKLIQNGKRINRFRNREGLTYKKFWKNRHPRTAIGIDRKNNLLYMLVVDGRQPGYSVGMSLKKLGKYLKKIGCDEALNFDGGGSSTMIFNQKIMNLPSDKNGERSVSNILYIMKR